jgi:hypothetical protein
MMMVVWGGRLGGLNVKRLGKEKKGRPFSVNAKSDV